MEIIKQEVENDSDNEEIYFGPITKREIVSKLKYYNLCKYELLQPLEVYQDGDILNDNLVKFYEDIFPTGSSSAETQNSMEHFPDSSNHSQNSFTESQLLQSECTEKNNELSIKSWKNIEDETALLNSTCFSVSTTEHNSTIDTTERENTSLDSTHENSGCKLYNSAENFNCTLEEMEMLMKFGENYINESKDTKPVDNVSVKSEKEVPSILNSFKKINIKSPLQIKENNILKPITPTINNKENKSKLPVQSKENKILTPNNKPSSHTKLTYIKSPSPFKIPSRIGKASPSFKNIQSPIAMYIKNSAQVPLMQNIAKATIEAGTYKTVSNNDLGENEEVEDIQEAGAGLPVRSYKRAPRAVLLSDEPEPSLPPSIRRLIPGRVTPQVIKHVGRTHTNTNSGSAVDNDLTLMSTSQAEGQPDVSFYISKNAARTNRLQRHL